MSAPIAPILKRYTITLANGRTEKFDTPIVVTVEGGALKITSPGDAIRATWHSPSAWRSMEVQQLKT